MCVQHDASVEASSLYCVILGFFNVRCCCLETRENGHLPSKSVGRKGKEIEIVL